MLPTYKDDVVSWRANGLHVYSFLFFSPKQLHHPFTKCLQFVRH